MRNKKHRGSLLMLLGLLLIAAAFFQAGYNLWDEQRAGDAARDVLKNFPADLKEKVLDEQPAYILNPDMEMPVVAVDGQDYIGILAIPSLELELPVMENWSYPNLKIAPCRYLGSVYQDDLVIAAHNYATHFGNIKNLKIGESVTFTDMDGNVFHYQVAEIEILEPHAVEEMQAGDWDLTLFSCTIGGSSRVTVRCERVENRYD